MRVCNNANTQGEITMKIFLTTQFFKSLLCSQKETKTLIEKEIVYHIQKNHKLYTASTSILAIFENSNIPLLHSNLEIINNIETLCDGIFPVNNETMNLSLKLRQEYQYPLIESIELSVSVLNRIDLILDTESTFSNQTLVSFERIPRKSK